MISLAKLRKKLELMKMFTTFLCTKIGREAFDTKFTKPITLPAFDTNLSIYPSENRPKIGGSE